MAEYIEREAAIEAIMSEPPDVHYPQWYAEKIKSIPAADVAPVRHERWIEKQEKDTFAGYLYSYECSECGRVEQRKEPYCPNCGAKMDLEDKHGGNPEN